MARINKSKTIKEAQGIPSKEDILTSPENKDTLTMAVQDLQGEVKGNVKVTEGEFVFAVPAIIALGEGDYDKGLETLTQIHDQLREMGKNMMGMEPTEGLAAALS